ncbi:MAG: hypothetical protein LBQ12_11045 [Deltaproteobacteria bacterium]|jgi:hypothetical protein|nr:hypothetical protein [Deltaproteobacteria bacterium]
MKIMFRAALVAAFAALAAFAIAKGPAPLTAGLDGPPPEGSALYSSFACAAPEAASAGTHQVPAVVARGPSPAPGSPVFGVAGLAGDPGSAPGIRLEIAQGSRKDGRKPGRGKAGSGEGQAGDRVPTEPKKRGAMRDRQKTINEKNEEAEKLKDDLLRMHEENEEDLRSINTA